MGQWGGHAISRKSRNEGMEAGRHGMYGRVGTRNRQEGEGLAGKGERALEWTLSTKKAIFFLSLESYNSSKANAVLSSLWRRKLGLSKLKELLLRGIRI